MGGGKGKRTRKNVVCVTVKTKHLFLTNVMCLSVQVPSFSSILYAKSLCYDGIEYPLCHPHVLFLLVVFVQLVACSEGDDVCSAFVHDG